MTLYDKIKTAQYGRTSPSTLDASYVIVDKLHARPMQLKICTSSCIYLELYTAYGLARASCMQHQSCGSRPFTTKVRVTTPTDCMTVGAATAMNFICLPFSAAAC